MSRELAGKEYDSTITRVAMWSAVHRRLVVIGWLAAVVLAFGACSAFPADTDVTQEAPGEAGVAAKLIDERFAIDSRTTDEFLVFSHPTLNVDDPAYRQTVENLAQKLRALRADASESNGGIEVSSSSRVVAGTTTYYDLGVPADQSPLVARGNPNITFALVELEGGDVAAEQNVDLVTSAVNAAQSEAPGFTILSGGSASASKQQSDLIGEDFARSLLITLPITFALLLLAFRRLVAALVPLALAFVAIAIATGILSVISQAYPLSEILLRDGPSDGSGNRYRLCALCDYSISA